MKFYKPFFSILLIIIQLALSIISHYEHIYAMKTLKENNPELFGLINIVTTYKTLFLFVFAIGFYEMITKPSLFKTLIRILLTCIILGTSFSYLIPIEDFYSGVYNTAWFSAVIAFVLIFVKIGNKYDRINKAKKLV